MAGIAMMEPVRARFAELVATMSPRDRALFVGLVAFVVASLLGGAWWLGSSYLGDVESRVEAKEETLAQIQALVAEHEAAAVQVAAIEADLRKNAGQDLPSFIEKKSSEAGLSANLQGVREKQIITEGTLEERTYGVELSKITLQQLTAFLHSIETDGYPLRVRTTKVKSVTQAGVKLLNVSMEVSAFKLVGEEAAAAAPEGGEEEK
jgi:type II secretory pathway component PulM